MTDLTTLSDVKTWLGRSDTNSDALLSALITRTSRQICSYLQRPLLLPRTVTEIRDGSYTNVIVLAEWPVLSVASVMTRGIAIPQAAGHGAGWSLDPWNGAPPGRSQALHLRGCGLAGAVRIVYQAGYQVTGEPQTVSGGSVSVAAPFGAWANDVSVAYANGVLLAKATSAPAVGQYALDTVAGTYDFNAGDDGAAVLISYGFVPIDLADACIELVAERYKYSQRIGEKTHSLGGNETVSFDNTRLTPLVEALLQPYRNIAAL